MRSMGRTAGESPMFTSGKRPSVYTANGTKPQLLMRGRAVSASAATVRGEASRLDSAQ